MDTTLMQLRTGPEGVLSRRRFLHRLGAGAATLGVLGWKEAVTLNAAQLRKQGLSCILMFMRGGPSQFETFDPKPGHANGGPTKAIETAAPGIRIAEHWPEVAKVMKEITLIRSLNNREGEHQRATYQLHTGYIPAGGVRHPSLGAIVAHEIGPKEFDLPHFVSVGGGRFGGIGAGFLGARYAPFVVGSPNSMPNNVALPVEADRYNRRLELLKDLEADFAAAGARARVEQHQALTQSAAQLVLSPELKAFDLNQEKSETRDRYGRTVFGQGCLLARRLVEAGVTFVEVDSNGWDTHQDNFNRSKQLAGQVDPGFAALVADLKERGLLERTLVIWMGEFGRTPRINGNTGRDHYPRAFNVAVAGAGIRGGQVIGATSDAGTDIARRPVSVADLFCSFCQALKINPRKENIANFGRPMKIVEGGEVVKELFA
jgi:hypothetical protein